MILELISEARLAGAGLAPACEILGLDPRTVQRWRGRGGGEDLRRGPKSAPPNKLTEPERARILQVANSPGYRDLSPRQIVPLLADNQAEYLASESSFFRILREADQLRHRERSKAPVRRARPREYVASGPKQVWSWDITYLRAPIRGSFYYLYMVVDIWSRKIVGAVVHDRECTDLASQLIESTCRREGVRRDQLVLHMDNGAPMKGATLQATLNKLEITRSYSRPRVSDDNPYSEALFRTLKYRPDFPNGPFASLESATNWVNGFVHWYNNVHLHSRIGFVAPAQRHEGKDVAVLRDRTAIWEAARERHPERWSREIRDWSPVEEVVLNPANDQAASEAA